MSTMYPHIIWFQPSISAKGLFLFHVFLLFRLFFLLFFLLFLFVSLDAGSFVSAQTEPAIPHSQTEQISDAIPGSRRVYIQREREMYTLLIVRLEREIYIYIERDRYIRVCVCASLSIHALSRREPHVGR